MLAYNLTVATWAATLAVPVIYLVTLYHRRRKEALMASIKAINDMEFIISAVTLVSGQYFSFLYSKSAQDNQV